MLGIESVNRAFALRQRGEVQTGYNPGLGEYYVEMEVFLNGRFCVYGRTGEEALRRAEKIVQVMLS